ncbi:tautomerase family protein [Kitasatospora sp. NPDC058190]|uniref:tautomerase family protein n=1 Tax=Kitasatospora sp. NPDC058190 TaxID=3346371 RepID=UPI0036DB45BF
MPVYQVSAPADSLSREDKRRIAEAITKIHVEVTAAPAEFVHTSFDAVAPGDHFVAAEPATDAVMVIGHIREGRSDTDKQRLLVRIAESVAEVTDRPVARVAVIVRDVPSRYIFEGGRIMPEPGQEAAWLAAASASARVPVPES